MKTNNKKQNSGGFLSAIAALFKGGAAAGSGVSGAAATGGIFASNAGIFGLLLGGATIAAGVGFGYQFINNGNTTDTASASSIFQNSYFEEEAAKAGAERSNSQDRRAHVNSSIGMFSEQAKKSGLGFEVQEEQQENSPAEENSYSDSSAYGSAGASAADYSASAASSSSPRGNRLTSKGMGSFGGGGASATSSSVPRMKSMGGLSGGVNSKFASMRSAALAENSGSATAMASAKKASISKGRSVSARGRRSTARSQAMFANAMGNKAAYSSSAAGARTSAQAAFTGETTGEGDVAEGVLEGAGLGGAGMSMGNALKANDPNNTNSIKNVPQPSAASNSSPWKDLEKALLITLAAATVLLITGSILASQAAKAVHPAQKAPLLMATAIIAGIVCAAAAAIVVMAGILIGKHKQTGMGITYIIAGAFLGFKGGKLMAEAISGYKDAKAASYDKDPEYQQSKAELDEKLKNKEISQKEYDKKLSEAQDKSWDKTKTDYKDAKKGVSDAKKDLNNAQHDADKVRSNDQKEINDKYKQDRKDGIDRSTAKDNKAEQENLADIKHDSDQGVQDAKDNLKAKQDAYDAEVNKYKPEDPKPETVSETHEYTYNKDGSVKTDTVTKTVKATPEPPKPTFGQQMAETLTDTVDQMGTQKITEGLTQGFTDVVSDDGGASGDDSGN